MVAQYIGAAFSQLGYLLHRQLCAAPFSDHPHMDEPRIPKSASPVLARALPVQLVADKTAAAHWGGCSWCSWQAMACLMSALGSSSL